MRRQTAGKMGQAELQVLDYDNVQQTLVPMIARSYALQFMVRRCCSSKCTIVVLQVPASLGVPRRHPRVFLLRTLCTLLRALPLMVCVCMRQGGSAGLHPPPLSRPPLPLNCLAIPPLFPHPRARR